MMSCGAGLRHPSSHRHEEPFKQTKSQKQGYRQSVPERQQAVQHLLKEARRLAIKDEVLAMRLRGRLVVPLVAIQPAKKKPTGTG